MGASFDRLRMSGVCEKVGGSAGLFIVREEIPDGKRKDGARPLAELGMSGGNETPRIIPNKNRVRQVAPTRRKLFGEAAKDEFLEWFAATCNCSLAARKTGFHYRTVIRHWREDEAFGVTIEREELEREDDEEDA